MGATIFPKTDISIIPSGLVQAIKNRRDVLVGQLGSGATAISEALNSDVQSLTNDEIKALFGTGELYYRFLSWRFGDKNYSPCDIIGISPGGSPAAATSTITVDADAVLAQTITVTLDVSKIYTITVPVEALAVKATIMTDIKNALNAVADAPWIATDDTVDTVTITTKDLGVIGNSFTDTTISDGILTFTVIDFVTLASGVGIAASSTITVNAVPSADTSFKIALIDEDYFDFEVDIDISVDNTVNLIAEKIRTELNTLSDLIYITTVAAGVVTITAKDLGTVGNYFGIKVSENTGIDLTVTGWTGTGTDPTLTSILDNLASIRETGLEWPEFWYSDLDIPADFMIDRWNSTANGVFDGVVFTGSSEVLTTQKTKSNSFNNQNLVFYGNDKENEDFDKSPSILKAADWVMATMMGIRSRRLTPNANISDVIVTTKGLLDNFGGPHLASLPYANTPLTNVPLTLANKLFSPEEQAELKAVGFSTYGINPANTEMISGEIVTTYKTNAIGATDLTYKYLNYVDTASIIRETFYNVLQAVYSQSRLSEGDLVPGISDSNAGTIKGTCKVVYEFLEGIGLTEKGDEAEAFFSDNLIVRITKVTGLATITAKVPIKTQLRQINFAMQLAFSLEGDFIV